MISCPSCKSSTINQLNYGRQVFVILGGSVGALGGTLAGLGIGAMIGATIMSSLNSIGVENGLKIGISVGGLIGGILGSIIISAIGAQVGKFIDAYFLHNYKCFACGHKFREDRIALIKATFHRTLNIIRKIAPKSL